jgi:hypothetical protein
MLEREIRYIAAALCQPWPTISSVKSKGYWGVNTNGRRGTGLLTLAGFARG